MIRDFMTDTRKRSKVRTMKVELLAPAGDLEKAKIALLYGADAVYIGGQKFSLRARASNFTLPMIEEITEFAHNLNKKVYITTNIVFHDMDTNGLDEYLLELDRIGVDAIICSSFVIIERAKALTALEIHLSTQFSVANSELANYFRDEGIRRVVLAREASIEEIKLIKKSTKVDLEIFIHGGMCVSYSGRCTLSNYMVLRDANRGGCAHSCRWLYDLYEDDRLISENHDFQMSSKDLETVEYIPQLLETGVASLKIEGRMKSIHYIATVVNTYRKLIDDYYKGEMKDFSVYKDNIKKAENRLTSTGFMGGETTTDQQLYNYRSETPTQDFVGIIKKYDPEKKLVTIEQRNYFTTGDTLEIFSPERESEFVTVKDMRDEEGNILDVARHPMQILTFPLDIPVNEYDLIRRVKNE